MAAVFQKERPMPGPGTVVGTNVKLTGVLKDTNDITVHGKVEGEVISDKNVLVTETAEIKGPVTAQNIIVAGKIHGTVNAEQKLELLPTAKVNGAINTRELIVKAGATLNGKSTMREEDKANDATKANSPATPEEDKKEPAYEVE